MLVECVNEWRECGNDSRHWQWKALPEVTIPVTLCSHLFQVSNHFKKKVQFLLKVLAPKESVSSYTLAGVQKQLSLLQLTRNAQTSSGSEAKEFGKGIYSWGKGAGCAGCQKLEESWQWKCLAWGRHMKVPSNLKKKIMHFIISPVSLKGREQTRSGKLQ